MGLRITKFTGLVEHGALGQGLVVVEGVPIVIVVHVPGLDVAAAGFLDSTRRHSS